MNIDVKPQPDADLGALGRKLDDLLGAINSVQERLAINEEVQFELVKFLSTTAQRQQDQLEALGRQLSGTSNGQKPLGFNPESQAGILEGLQRQLAAANADMKTGIEARLRPLYGLAMMALRKAPPVGRIRCVFLVHAIETWDALADLHKAMLEDDRFSPIVATINRRYPGQDSFGNEDKTSAFLTGLGVEHLRFGMQDSYEGLNILKSIMPDIVFRQSQWDNDIAPAFRTGELHFTRLCLVPYASLIIQRFDMNERVQDDSSTFAYDQPYHRMAWRIFSETHFSQANYRVFHGYDPAKVVLSGFPKNQRLMQSIGSDNWPIASGGRRRFRVVWAPHHSLGNSWLAFGVFHLMFEQMLAWAQERPDIDFVLKPHPALYSTAVKEAFVQQQRIDRFDQTWRALPNCAVCDGQYADLFASSDLLVTDGVSFLAEYQLFDKPLVYYDSRRHVPFNGLGELAEAAAHVVTNFGDMQSAVLGYMSGKPWAFEQERSELRKAMVPREKSPVDIIMDEIADGLGVSAHAPAPTAQHLADLAGKTGLDVSSPHFSIAMER